MKNLAKKVSEEINNERNESQSTQDRSFGTDEEELEIINNEFGNFKCRIDSSSEESRSRSRSPRKKFTNTRFTEGNTSRKDTVTTPVDFNEATGSKKRKRSKKHRKTPKQVKSRKKLKYAPLK